MRIWIINHYAVPPTSSGGTRHFSLARYLIKKGHEVVIVAANYSHFSHTYMTPISQKGKLDTTYDVPFYWLPVPPYKGNTIARFWNMLVFSWNIRKILSEDLLLPPDVIIGSSPHLFAALGAELISRRLKVPFVLEIRDIWPDTLVDLGKFTHRHPLIKAMKWIEKYLYRRAKKVITLLPCSAEYLSRYGIQKSRLLWLPNSVDTDWVHSTKKNESAMFRVMYAGAHGFANDLETVILAAEILQKKGLANQIEILLIGDGPDKSVLQYLATQKNVKMIRFLDSVPKTEIYSVLESADVFLMLLKKSPVFRWGISPNKLFGYFAMGRPVIFGVETPINPVKEYQAGISIPSSDPEALATAIHDLYLLPASDLVEMGRRGNQYVSDHHDIVKLSASLESMLIEVCREA